MYLQVGISAGSGLLVTYLGKEGEATPVRAAAALCPAYDITRAFRYLVGAHGKERFDHWKCKTIRVPCTIAALYHSNALSRRLPC